MFGLTACQSIVLGSLDPSVFTLLGFYMYAANLCKLESILPCEKRKNSTFCIAATNNSNN